MAKVMNAITNFSTIGVVTLSALYLADNYYKFGLNREPGPLLAKLSPLWYRFEKSIGSFPSTMLRLHDEYGPIVRIGPNMLSLNSPDYLGKLHWLREQSEMVSALVKEK